MSYVYDGKFEGNILVVRRTGCGKTGNFGGGINSSRMGIIREIRQEKGGADSVLF